MIVKSLEIGTVLPNVVWDTQYTEYPVQPEAGSSCSQEAPAIPTCSDHNSHPSTPLGEGGSFSRPPSCAASPCFPDGEEEETRTDEETEEDELGDGEQEENSGDDVESYEDGIGRRDTRKFGKGQGRRSMYRTKYC